MDSYIFPYIQKCLEILSDQFKVASSTPLVYTIDTQFMDMTKM